MEAGVPGAGGGAVQVAFPGATRALLEALNRQRLAGQLCDLAIHVQGRVFRAHRAVLAASSPYFHDQVLLKDLRSVELPAVLDPAAFEAVLGSAYTGRLRMARDDLVNFLTAGSVLQMWHIVDKCTELLKERQRRGPEPPSTAAGQQSPSSSSYFSPRRDGPEQPRAGGGAPRGGGERDAEEGLCRAAPPRRRRADPDGGGTSSCEARRPVYARPSIVPQRQWVPVKKERGGVGGLPEEEEEDEEEEEEEEEEALVLTCEEEEEEEAALSISDVRTLSQLAPPEEQVNFCESSQAGPEEGVSPLPPAAPTAFPPRPLLPLDVPALFPATAATQGACASGLPSVVEHGAVQLSGVSGGASGAEGSKIFLCHCGKAFSHKSMRDRHVNMHLNLRPFDCPVCNKKFKMKHHLTEHMKTHTGLKPYQCHVCAKKFMWRDSFMRHKGHCERRHRLGAGGALAVPSPGPGVPKEEASPSRGPGEAEWTPRHELGFAGGSKM